MMISLSKSSTKKCKEILLKDQRSLAVDVFVRIADATDHRILFVSLADDIFDAAIKRGEVSVCGKVLRWKAKCVKPESMQGQAETLIRVCGDKQQYDALADVIFRSNHIELPMLLLHANDAHVKSILALACSTDPSLSRWFELFYRDIPRESRAFVDEFSAILTLNATWKATRNIEEVEAQLRGLSDRLRRNGDEKALRKLDETVLEIYISANRTDRALRRIARMNKTKEVDARIMCLGALLFAKKQAWDPFRGIIEIIKNAKSFQFDQEAKRLFNEIIRVHAGHHDAQEIWQFVTAAIETLGFAPTSATTQIVLEAFVDRKQLNLISDWEDYVENRGYKLKLGSRGAVAVLRRYYLNHRPSHIIMMWLCRKLIYHSPQLASVDMADLVKQAIGYDMRSSFGQRARSQRSDAKMRLDRFKDTDEAYIPSHGFKVNDQLYFPEADAEFPELPVPKTLAESTSSGQDVEAERASISPHPAPQDTAAKSNYSAFLNDAGDEAALQSEGVTLDQPQIAKVPEADENSVFDNEGKNTQVETTLDFAPEDDALAFGFDAINGSTNLESRMDERQEKDDELIEALNAEVDSTAASQPRQRQSSLQGVPNLVTRRSGVAEPQFDDLRSLYQESNSVPDRLEYLLDRKGRKKLEGDMMVELSSEQYDKVLEIYHRTLDAVGIPASPMALEIAIEASLRLHPGDKSNAELIMSNAQRAGMNASCAMGPMLIRQMRNLNPSDKSNVAKLRRAVIDYYRMNDEQGWHVKHHVGITAASALIRNRHAAQGINILCTVYNSKWTTDRPLNIVAMTVFLKGYIAIQSIAGIQWVVRTVMDRDMRISKRFLYQLRLSVNISRSRREKLERLSGSSAQQLLRSLVDIVQERLTMQMRENKELGWSLVRSIVKITQGAAVIEEEKAAQKELDDGKTLMKGFQLQHQMDQQYPDDEEYMLRKRVREDGMRGQVLKRRVALARHEHRLAKVIRREQGMLGQQQDEAHPLPPEDVAAQVVSEHQKGDADEATSKDDLVAPSMNVMAGAPNPRLDKVESTSLGEGKDDGIARFKPFE